MMTKNPFFYLVFGVIEAGERFLYHWYILAFHLYWNRVIRFLARLDLHLAFKVTFLHILKPLYQDYTVLGYFFGFCFRGIRLCMGAVIYGVAIGIAVLVYLVWIVIPVALFIYAL